MPSKKNTDELTRFASEDITEELPEALPVTKEKAPRKSRAAKKAEEAALIAEDSKHVGEDEDEEAPKKVKIPPTSAKATAKNVRVTPQKARPVVDLVRGKSVNEALAILENVNKAAAEPVSKVIKSAASNATNNFGMDMDSLYISEIYANDGLRMKRYLPRAKGRASHLVKRTTHLTCVVRMR